VQENMYVSPVFSTQACIETAVKVRWFDVTHLLYILWPLWLGGNFVQLKILGVSGHCTILYCSGCYAW